MNVVYRTYLEPMQTHMHALFVLADGARWATIKNFEVGYLSAFHAPRQQGSTAFKALRVTMRRSCVFLCRETAPFLIAQWQTWGRDLTITLLDVMIIVLLVSGLLACVG